MIPAGWLIKQWDGHGHFKSTEVPKILELVLEQQNTG
jgi:hypothetical protein